MRAVEESKTHATYKETAILKSAVEESKFEGPS